MTEPSGHPNPGDLLAFVAGELSPPAREEIERHVTICVECAEALDELASGYEAATLLGEAGTDEIATRVLVRAHLAASREQSESSAAPSPDRRGSRLAIALMLAVSFVAGGALGWSSGAIQVAELDAPATHLLLLGTPPETPESGIEAYSRWSAQLRSEGRLVAAEALIPERRTAGVVGPPLLELQSALDAITGFYLVRAPSDAAAEALALQSPTVRQGGGVLVLPILPTARLDLEESR